MKINPNAADCTRSPRVSVIIVNWNGQEHLPVCLDSLREQTLRDFEVILVDNGSTDGSVVLVRDHYPWVKLVELAGNQGFAGGNNVGFEHASGDYLVTLNNDTRVEADWLEELVAAAHADPGAGMVASRIVAFEDPERIDSLGLSICPDGMARGTFRQRRFSSLQLAPVEEILAPSACAALYKRAMIEEVGFFDEAFFAYCEDTDLGLRGRLAGWRALLATRAVVGHKYSGTGGAFSPFKLRLVERNHYWVALKSFPLSMLLGLPLSTLVRYLAQARSILARQGSGQEFLAASSKTAAAKAILRGMAEALAGAPKMLEKRRLVMKKRKIPESEMRRLLKKHRLSFAELFDRLPE